MIGHRSARYERFGWAAARLDDVVDRTLLAPAAGQSGRPIQLPIPEGGQRRSGRIACRAGSME